MKKIFCLLLASVIIFALFGCDSSYAISGIENFSENDCSMGLNDGLLPSDQQFLSDYPYENGSYHYWTDGDYSVAKTFVMLQYSEDVYAEAKAVCEAEYSFSETQFYYEDFTFSKPDILFERPEFENRGAQMLGYNDDTCILIFVGFIGYEIDQREMFSQSEFAELFDDEFRSFLTEAIL